MQEVAEEHSDTPTAVYHRAEAGEHPIPTPPPSVLPPTPPSPPPHTQGVKDSWAETGECEFPYECHSAIQYVSEILKGPMSDKRQCRCLKDVMVFWLLNFVDLFADLASAAAV